MTNEEYVKMQKMWLKSTGVEPGSWVKVTRKAKTGESGWDNMWLPEMDEDVGKILQVNGDCGAKGISLSLPHTKMSFPFFVLEPAEEPGLEKHRFQLFEQVLVRVRSGAIWHASLFGVKLEGEIFPFKCVDCSWKECVPYAGHEHLLGTKDEPEDWAKYYDKKK